jgi:hypothetical protein
MINRVRLQLIHCPVCGQGVLRPFVYLPRKIKLLICSECEATWLINSEIKNDNTIDLDEYINSLSENLSLPIGDTDKDITELGFETIINNESSFGQFPPEATNFNVYINNYHCILECRIRKSEFYKYLHNTNLFFVSSDINPTKIVEPTRIARFCCVQNYEKNTNTQSKNNLLSIHSNFHVAREGLYQFFPPKWGVYFRHLVYDSENEMLYWYQLFGKKKSVFFEEALKLHNIIYPNRKLI